MADQYTAPAQVDMTEELIRRSKWHVNLRQELIATTEDRLRLCLRDYAESVARRQSWLAPGSLLATFVLVFTTADFKDALGFTVATWEAVFLLCLLASLIWLGFSLYAAWNAKPSIEALIAKIKEHPPGLSPPDGGA